MTGGQSAHPLGHPEETPRHTDPVSFSSRPGAEGQPAQDGPDQAALAPGEPQLPRAEDAAGKTSSGVREDVKPPTELAAVFICPTTGAPPTEQSDVSAQLNAPDEEPSPPPVGLIQPVGPMPTLWQATRLVLIIFAVLAAIGLLAQSVHPGH